MFNPLLLLLQRHDIKKFPLNYYDDVHLEYFGHGEKLLTDHG